jgi:hypothetical protein
VALAIFLALPLALFSASIPILATAMGFLEGSIAARCDIAKGHYKIRTVGLPWFSSWTRDYERLLQERYGIEYVHGGCVVSEWLSAYINAYDAVSTSGAIRKFGHDVFQECETDAKKIEHTVGGTGLRRDPLLR